MELKHDIRLLRDKNYLKWRFSNFLEQKYSVIGFRSNSTLHAIAVVKFEYIFSEKCLVVMDLAYDNVSNASKLLNNIENIFIGEKISFVLKSGISKDKKIDRPLGFIRVPNILNPRKLYLLARWTNSKLLKRSLKNFNWQVTFADWDVF